MTARRGPAPTNGNRATPNAYHGADTPECTPDLGHLVSGRFRRFALRLAELELRIANLERRLDDAAEVTRAD